MDFRKFKNININVKNVDIKINPTVWDSQPVLYNNTVVIDGTSHNITVVRCGYIGLVFLLVDNQPTFQLYGSHQTIAENIGSLNLSDEIIHQINRFIEYNDWKIISAVLYRRYKKNGVIAMEKIIIYSNGTKILIIGNAINTDLLCEYIHIVNQY